MGSWNFAPKDSTTVLSIPHPKPSFSSSIPQGLVSSPMLPCPLILSPCCPAPTAFCKNAARSRDISGKTWEWIKGREWKQGMKLISNHADVTGVSHRWNKTIWMQVSGGWGRESRCKHTETAVKSSRKIILFFLTLFIVYFLALPRINGINLATHLQQSYVWCQDLLYSFLFLSSPSPIKQRQFTYTRNPDDAVKTNFMSLIEHSQHSWNHCIAVPQL